LGAKLRGQGSRGRDILDEFMSRSGRETKCGIQGAVYVQAEGLKGLDMCGEGRTGVGIQGNREDPDTGL
jgi:hypothetical protein